jgi:hypothetical protein
MFEWKYRKDKNTERQQKKLEDERRAQLMLEDKQREKA